MVDRTFSSSAKPKLLRRVRLAARAAHYSVRTEAAYLGWVRRFVRFHGLRHPGELGEAEVAAFLTHLAAVRKVAPSTQQQAFEPGWAWSSEPCRPVAGFGGHSGAGQGAIAGPG